MASTTQEQKGSSVRKPRINGEALPKPQLIDPECREMVEHIRVCAMGLMTLLHMLRAQEQARTSTAEIWSWKRLHISWHALAQEHTKKRCSAVCG